MEDQIKRIIREHLQGVIPVPVRISVDATSITVWWPQYQLSWVGRPEQHKLRAISLVRTAFNRNLLTRLVGLLAVPFVASAIAHDPIILMPRTEVVYPARRMVLTLDTASERDILITVADWAKELRRAALADRGAIGL